MCIHMFLYTSSHGASLSICSCAKCGSSMLSHALFFMVMGTRWSHQGKPWVHDYANWNVSNVTDSNAPGSLHIIVHRDPVERYISAYHSKLKCCEGSTNRPCFQDAGYGGGSLSLHRCLGVGGRVPPCMNMSAYVAALATCHARRMQAEMDVHFRPQDFACPSYPGQPTIMVPVGEIENIFAAARGFGLHRPNHHAFATKHGMYAVDGNPEAHPLSGPGEEGWPPHLLAKLRRLSKPEYRYISSYWRRRSL